jgi:hypothetical protein
VTALVLILGFVMLPLVSPSAAHPSGARCCRRGPRASDCSCSYSRCSRCTSPGAGPAGAHARAKTWHLHIVGHDGAPPSRRSALARYLAAWIGPVAALIAYGVLHARGWGAHAAWLVALNWLWAFIDRDRGFLHDRIAGRGS